ncbi:hypothetical protein Pmar_PMAR017770 [Perkinsus marinus ATCC 50983]|uniref:Uncharacterized protein n=1 Tax=Perkinsus marinus (strain ATCC 50983 / TXsc) TaxID=423536 RepID=C5L3Y3_PERM5|nr:hypothetical protein Pmar_PMAR017770 [Perkinsus marinus ATCC 50983]EER08712.1 hypothetical protein Pmar_PMAR017770 [Perkinsus marinus ATCC 50983]|eukprot:XP_002776896.1 hypothetical protein Pmar_PMAR017770 [Perkinsus marinus ATCC 50983]
MTNPELSTAIHSYKHAVLAYLNFDYWAKIVPVAEKALKTPHRDTGESLTAGLLAVDFLTWSRQVQRGKEMLATVERVADETGQAYPEYISNLLKAYQSCIKATDYEKAYGYFYRSWATGPHHEDLFALKRAQVMALKCGRSDLIHEAIAELYKTHSFSLSTIPFMAGMVSFGLEQAGDYSGAERFIVYISK